MAREVENPGVEDVGTRLRLVADAVYDGNKSELARGLDMSPGSFAKYTRGERVPGGRILKRLARLGINLNWFLTGEGSMMSVEKSPLSTGSSSEPVIHKSGNGASVAQLREDQGQYCSVPFVQVQFGAEDDVQLNHTGEWGVLRRERILHQYGVDLGRLRGFRVSCNRMADTLRPGDQALGALLPADVRIERITGGTVCLVSGPEGVIGTRLFRDDEEKDSVVLVADNPDVNDVELSLKQWKEAYRPVARLLEVLRPL